MVSQNRVPLIILCTTVSVGYSHWKKRKLPDFDDKDDKKRGFLSTLACFDHADSTILMLLQKVKKRPKPILVCVGHIIIGFAWLIRLFEIICTIEKYP
jgi:hypothetical protein